MYPRTNRDGATIDDAAKECAMDRVTSTSRLHRRHLLKGAAAGVAATALGGASKRSTFAAPAFLQSTNLVFAISDEDAPKIQPLIDEYQAANNVTIEMQPNPYA